MSNVIRLEIKARSAQRKCDKNRITVHLIHINRKVRREKKKPTPRNGYSGIRTEVSPEIVSSISLFLLRCLTLIDWQSITRQWQSRWKKKFDKQKQNARMPKWANLKCYQNHTRRNKKKTNLFIWINESSISVRGDISRVFVCLSHTNKCHCWSKWFSHTFRLFIII